MTIRQTIICKFKAPLLKEVLSRNSIELNECWELYEKQMREKIKDPGTNIILMLLKATIYFADLRYFLAAEWIKDRWIGETTETQINESFQRRCYGGGEGRT